jgi:hypothetical protein
MGPGCAASGARAGPQPVGGAGSSDRDKPNDDADFLICKSAKEPNLDSLQPRHLPDEAVLPIREFTQSECLQKSKSQYPDKMKAIILPLNAFVWTNATEASLIFGKVLLAKNILRTWNK